MTITTAIIVNALLAAGIVTALALVVRAAHRISPAAHAETVHPSQPIRLELLREEQRDRELARVA